MPPNPLSRSRLNVISRPRGLYRSKPMPPIPEQREPGKLRYSKNVCGHTVSVRLSFAANIEMRILGFALLLVLSACNDNGPPANNYGYGWSYAYSYDSGVRVRYDGDEMIPR